MRKTRILIQRSFTGDYTINDPILAKVLKSLSSILGITKYKLYKATYIEYRRYPAVYDLEYGNQLLALRILYHAIYIQNPQVTISQVWELITTENEVTSLYNSQVVTPYQNNPNSGICASMPILKYPTIESLVIKEGIEQAFNWLSRPDLKVPERLLMAMDIYYGIFWVDAISDYTHYISTWIAEILEVVIEMVPEGDKNTIRNILERSILPALKSEP